ncbi:sugar ABC transporter substrate-binding protein [Paenibacillus sp.]|uniref:ABC transporter substrate-binding protein n=1 Tax=Paenibacillus sp. TaxID=58172 RepID=UPI0028AE1672|nr:sugar ABC transporter substrate-binding protein [Paenibacillus sp.]
MYKKITGVLLSALMVFAIVGCNSGTESKKEDAAKGDNQNVELKMLFWDKNQEPGLKAMADDFMAKNPTYKITVETIPWNEYWTKLQAAATGGDMPDIVVMHPDQVENYAQGGMLMDLTDLLTNSQTANKDKFPQYVVDDFEVDGKYYGVPKDVGTLALVYNKDLFDQAKVPYPNDNWTWDDMMNAAQKITDKSKGIYGIAAQNDGQNFYWNLIWQNGGDMFSKDGKTSTFDSQEAIDAVKYGVSFIEKGYSPTIADFANLSPNKYFSSGKVGMVFDGSWMLTEYLAVKDLNFDVAELPKGKERAAIASGMAFSVSAKTKNKDASLKFVEYLGSKEAQEIGAKLGISIPAYENIADPWVAGFKTIDASPFVKVIEYGHRSPGLNTSNEGSAVVHKYMPEVFSMKRPVDDGLKQIAKEINALNK